MNDSVDASRTARLRIPRPTPFHIVLVNPEIPQNTGGIGRLCVATGAHLHLVGTIGFSLDEKAVRRAGLDYWHRVNVQTHKDFSACLRHVGNANPILFSSKAGKSFLEAPYEPGSVLVFGSESAGLPDAVVEQYPHNQYAIPTLSRSVRSINLANSVAVTLFKGLEVTGALNSYIRTP